VVASDVADPVVGGQDHAADAAVRSVAVLLGHELAVDKDTIGLRTESGELPWPLLLDDDRVRRDLALPAPDQAPRKCVLGSKGSCSLRSAPATRSLVEPVNQLRWNSTSSPATSIVIRISYRDDSPTVSPNLAK